MARMDGVIEQFFGTSTAGRRDLRKITIPESDFVTLGGGGIMPRDAFEEAQFLATPEGTTLQKFQEEQERKRLEEEARRQYTPAQKQERVVLLTQRSKAMTDPTYKPEERIEAILQIDEKLVFLDNNKQGEIARTAEEIWKSTRVWTDGQWMVPDEKGVYRLAGRSAKETDTRRKDMLKAVVEMMSTAKPGQTEQTYSLQEAVEAIFSMNQLLEDQEMKAGGGELPLPDAAGAPPLGAQPTAEQTRRLQQLSGGRSTEQIERDLNEGIPGEQQDEVGAIETFEDLSQGQLEEILEKQRKRERSRQHILTIGGKRKFKKQSEEHFIESLKTKPELLQEIIKEHGFVKELEGPPNLNWENATKEQRKQAFAIAKDNVEPGEERLTFRKFKKLMIKNPKDFRELLGKGINDFKKKTLTDFGKRPDGTQKGNGFQGVLKRPDGGVSTEISVGVQLEAKGGKETDIPTILPDTKGKELKYLLGTPIEELFTKDPALWEAIMQKAVDHANKRVREGKSVFAEGTQ